MKRILGLLSMAVWQIASAQSPAPELPTVKTMAVEFAPGGELSAACKAALKGELHRLGRTIVDDSRQAEAVMSVLIKPSVLHKPKLELNYGLVVRDTSSRKVDWHDSGVVTFETPSEGCGHLATRIGEKLLTSANSDALPSESATSAKSTSESPSAEPAASEGVTPPELVHKVNPDFPASLRKARIEGRVIVQAVIDKDGNVSEAEVMVSTNPGFDESAIAAVKRRKYKPATREGQPIPIYVTILSDFSLR